MARLIFLVAILFATAVYADETIPLKDIWAYEMPGTRALKDGMRDGKYPSEETRLVAEIRASLLDPGEAGPGKGFVVTGKDIEALRAAHKVLVKKESADQLKSNSETSLVFFSYPSGRYVHIKDVQIHDKTIDVKYELVPHDEDSVTEHIALIPLGKLSKGTYSVKFNQLPMADAHAKRSVKPISDEQANKFVCHSFEFSVEENSK